MTPASELSVPGSLLARIRDHAVAAYPEECCGALLGTHAAGRRHVVDVVPVANGTTESRRRRYLIGPEDVLALEHRAAGLGLEVVGYYHSHPDHPAEPSDFDARHAWPWYTYLIVAVPGGVSGEVRAWRLAEDGAGFEPESMAPDGSEPG